MSPLNVYTASLSGWKRFSDHSNITFHRTWPYLTSFHPCLILSIAPLSLHSLLSHLILFTLRSHFLLFSHTYRFSLSLILFVSSHLLFHSPPPPLFPRPSARLPIAFVLLEPTFNPSSYHSSSIPFLTSSQYPVEKSSAFCYTQWVFKSFMIWWKCRHFYRRFIATSRKVKEMNTYVLQNLSSVVLLQCIS